MHCCPQLRASPILCCNVLLLLLAPKTHTLPVSVGIGSQHLACFVLASAAAKEAAAYAAKASQKTGGAAPVEV